MKKIIFQCSLFLCMLLMVACQNEDELSNSNVGYLRLSLGVDTSVNTRADGEDVYDPEQMTVQIVNAGNEVVETVSVGEGESPEVSLAPGTYTVKASSAGFDGKTSGWEKPYYAGSAEVEIRKGESTPANITCTLANVKVTIKFDKTFVDAFTKAEVSVDDLAGETGIDPLTFVMNETTQSGYFPVTDLNAKVTATNHNDVSNTSDHEITGVKARDHYILTYKVAEKEMGSGNVTITVDSSTKTYSYTFYVPTDPTTQLAVADANAWAKLAYLTGNVVTSKDELTPAKMKFQYRKKDVGEWTDAVATLNGETYEGKVVDLTPETTYEYRMVYGEEQFVTEVKEFTTEAATVLYNGDFELWSQKDETIYPDSAKYAGNELSFWNTSNPGTTQGLGAIGGALNPTTSATSPVQHGQYAAQLKSAFKIIAFAAASLYTGNFAGLSGMSANMEFGKPFTGHPIALHGYYKYSPVVINHVDRMPEGVNIVEGETMDECSIFIALAKKSFTFNNNDESSYIDYEGDDNIIAYGELPSGAATSGDGYTEFTIPLKYKSLTEKPTHIIIVCSASKYGDYMTGGEGSTLYVDNFSLVYDGEPAIWE